MGVQINKASIRNSIKNTLSGNNSGGSGGGSNGGFGSGGGSNSSPDDAVKELMRYVRLHTPPQIKDSVGQYGVKFTGGRKTKLVAHISFYKSKIKRKSVAPHKFGGVDNIIALLNNGYHASNSLWGYWHGEKIKTLKDRNSLRFMQKAIKDFNSAYGIGHGCKAELSDLYEK